MNSERYLRQITLKGFGTEGQEKLTKAKILVVGAGGLGVPVLQYLNAMGVGTLGIVEHDRIEMANLQRQVLYDECDLGKPKLEVALKKLKTQNPATKFLAFKGLLGPENAEDIISQFELIIDATDNFLARYLINDTCVLQNKPFVYGALHAFEGQVSVFNHKGGPTYRCLFPEMPSAQEIPDCNTNGVLGIIPGIIGSLQALEAVKIITGIGEVLSGKLLIFDGLTQSTRKIKFSRNSENLQISSLQRSHKVSSKIPSITPTEVLELLNSNQQLQLLDVRTPEEYEKSRLPNTLNIPLQELKDRVSEIAEDNEVYVLCQSGARSKKAVELLRSLNFRKPIHIEGGMNQLEKYVVGTK